MDALAARLLRIGRERAIPERASIGLVGCALLLTSFLESSNGYPSSIHLLA